MFDPVDTKVSFPAIEEQILAFWKDCGIAERAFNKVGPLGDFVFFEGPPTANGVPALHHVSARAFKDLFPRYKTMLGYRVQRRGGWDTHGLPVEVEIEKRIGSTGKADIEKFGVAKFNQLCRDSVFRYIQDWNALTERIGFWIDLKHAYITYSQSYIETCWWILKSLWDRGLLYRDYKVTMHCPRCNTSLADHEVSLGMKENVDDPSVWPKFPARRETLVRAGVIAEDEDRSVFFLPWTTTPWTLAANTALAVRGDAEYSLVEGPPQHGQEPHSTLTELFILATSRVADTFGSDKSRVLNQFKGGVLVGTAYEPILNGRLADGDSLVNAYRVISDTMVSIDDGTGIVHIAPAYGDLEIGKKHNLPTMFSVDLTGHVMPEVRLANPLGEVNSKDGPYTNLFFKDADKSISKDLMRAGLMYRVERTRHAYPFCWRDDSPLLFYAKNSWYIRTTAVKDKLLANNVRINWVPANIKAGRFGRWLENNVDWAISRERYWGCPLPIWESQDGSDRICVGSVAELSELVGEDLRETDLHRPSIDEVYFVRNGQTYRRVPYTVDVWFESGAMPYAQWHYPFENDTEFRRSFPGDFICEAVDQTRGWFYSLHALATLLTDTDARDRTGSSTGPDARRGPLAALFPDSPAFRNGVVLGFITDAEGKKMSKSRGNAVDPWKLLSDKGADAVRWYLYSSGPFDQNKAFDPAHVTEVVRAFFLTLWNVYCFFVLYARIDQPDFTTHVAVSERPDTDRWLLAKLHALIARVTEQLELYNATGATRSIQTFVVDDLSKWYVRNNRRRFWKSGHDLDKLAAYLTLHEVLLSVAKLMAPMAPFLSEAMYQNLCRKLAPEAIESVHLCEWPVADPDLVDHTLLADMEVIMRAIELTRAARSAAKIKVRQPLSQVIVRPSSDRDRESLQRFKDTLLSELNVKEMTLIDSGASFVKYVLRPNLPLIGKRLGRDLPLFRTALETIDTQSVIENVRRGSSTPIVLGDRTIEFEPEAFVIDRQGPDSYSVMEQGGLMVALDTRLSEPLVMEGRVREFVHHIQNARKNAGFAVTDYIQLGVQVPEALRCAIEANQDYVRQESLVTTLQFDALTDSSHTENIEVDAMAASLTLKRTAD